MPAESELVFSYRKGDVAIVVLDRPKAYNALGTRPLRQLGAAMDACSTARAIVLASQGQHFCVGADLAEMSSAFGSEERIRSFLGLFHQVVDSIALSPVPVIAAIEGLALAGGLELALACDLIVAADTAEFADQHINVDLIPGGGGSQRLPRAIGTRRALALQLTGERIDARRALEWGLVHSICPAATVQQEAIRLAARIAARDQSAVNHIRDLSRLASTHSLDEGLVVELETAVAHMSGSELPEALRRFERQDRTAEIL